MRWAAVRGSRRERGSREGHSRTAQRKIDRGGGSRAVRQRRQERWVGLVAPLPPAVCVC